MWTYFCGLHRVVDGDTIDLNVDLGFHLVINIRVRLLDVDTPEIRGEERTQGLIAKAYVEEWLGQAEQLRVTTEKTGKYGRWLGVIWRDTDPVSLNTVLRERYG